MYAARDIIILLTIGITLVVPTNAEPIGPLKCNLTWVTSATDGKVPAKSIASQMGTHFVIKGTTGPEQGTIGRMSATNGTNGPAFIPNSSTVKELQVYQALNNVYDCLTEWVLPGDERIQKLAFELEGKRIGRVMDSTDNTLLPGFISGAEIVYVDLNKVQKTSREFYVLISYSKGLSLLLSDFEFTNDNSEGLDFMGLDEIRNEAEVEVTQTVTHSKSVTESFTFSEHESQTTSFSISVNVDVSAGLEFIQAGVGLGVEFGMSWESGMEKEVSTTRSRDIEVSRTIAVPPLTRIQACSTIKSKENFTLPYTCLGRYKAPGMTGSQVVNLLREETDLQAYAEREFAVVEIRGTLTGSMSLSTQFIVTPIDALYGCSEMELDIENERSRLRKQQRRMLFSKITN
ncbi:uncharacterized protein LOC118437584 [Folsomia candida]|uniref:Natterin-like protein n=1 Tax=Folsomia candida TaxID=158441 RepID=A0A226DRZ0_FOLCA|nr:uncharacterized protein LOC118437584 [Folsomia candida]XP_035712635.1 uncharacterized protein LOC118437584 [Folsomia candida]OXA46976.1 Natterin-like protein [Folsomia candida]